MQKQVEEEVEAVVEEHHQGDWEHQVDVQNIVGAPPVAEVCWWTIHIHIPQDGNRKEGHP